MPAQPVDATPLYQWIDVMARSGEAQAISTHEQASRQDDSIESVAVGETGDRGRMAPAKPEIEIPKGNGHQKAQVK